MSPYKDMIWCDLSTANHMLLTVAAVAIFRSELLDIRPVKGLIGGGGGGMIGRGAGLGLVSGDHLLLTE